MEITDYGLVCGNKFFELTNHLGNVLETITDKKIPVIIGSSISYYTADVVSANDYYPFGMTMPGRSYSSGNDSYRYGFNGKENDNDVKGEGNQQDYGLRIYDPRLGRFLSVDPLTKQYPELTPYQFASNTPIMAIDLDGKEAWVCIWGSQSKDVDGDGRPEIGLTAIVLANYDKVIDATGKASYTANGTYTYYDFWPTSADLSGKAAISDVAGVAQKQTFVMQRSGTILKDQKEVEAFMKTHDMTQISDLVTGATEKTGPGLPGAEGRSADGIIKMNLGPEQSYNLNETFNTMQSSTTIYNGESNNCTTFVCDGLKSVGVSISPEKIVDWRGFFANGSPTHYSTTPNNTYKQLSTKPNTTIVKDGKQATKENYEDAILDTR